MEEQQQNRRYEDHWHLDKRLNVGHILTTLTLAGAMFVWASRIENIQAVHSTEIALLKAANKEQITLIRDELRELRQEVRNLRYDLRPDEQRPRGGK